MASHRNHPLGCAILLALAGGAPCPVPAADPVLSADPAFFQVGSFSSRNPLQSETHPGSTDVHILSSGPWRLEIQLEGPMRRIPDGLELPLDRAARRLPGIAPELLDLQPSVFASGSGSPVDVPLTVDWLDLATGLQTYLDPYDPAGTYEVSLHGRLLDPDAGTALTDDVTVTMQFEIQPWAEFLAAGLPPYEIVLDGADPFGSGAVGVLSITGNAGWKLCCLHAGDLTAPDGGAVLAASDLKICLESTIPPDGWLPVQPGCRPVGEGPLDLAVCSANQDPGEHVHDVPFHLVYEGPEPPPAGRYRTMLEFEISVQGATP